MTWEQSFPPSMAALSSIRRFVGDAAESTPLGGDATYGLCVAVSEACANAIEHSNVDSELLITMLLTEDALVTRVWHGSDFRIVPTHKEGTSTRGMGLPLMIALTDETRFSRHREGGTVIELVLRLPEG